MEVRQKREFLVLIRNNKGYGNFRALNSQNIPKRKTNVVFRRSNSFQLLGMARTYDNEQRFINRQ